MWISWVSAVMGFYFIDLQHWSPLIYTLPVRFPVGQQRYPNKKEHSAIVDLCGFILFHGLWFHPHPLFSPGTGCGRPRCSVMAHQGPFKIIKKDMRGALSRITALWLNDSPVWLLISFITVYRPSGWRYSEESDTRY